MKKISAVILSLMILAGSASADFSDVANTDSHAAAIASLVNQEILEGYGDGTFKPDQEVNRAEALKIILMGTDVAIDEESTAGILFSDVDEEDWFFSYVSTGVALGIIQGYDDGNFKPDQTVNRAEAIKMLLAAAEISEDQNDLDENESKFGFAESSTSSPFQDVAVDAWYAPYASYSKTWNVEPPQTDGLWHGEEAITRGDISEMVYRLQETDELGHSFDEATNWLTKDFPTVDISMKVPFGWGYKQEGVAAVFMLDRENDQVSLLTPYENGGTLLLTRYANSDDASADNLFASIKANTSFETEAKTINGNDVLVVYHEEGLYFREWYISLDNGSLVHAVAMRGDGAYASYLEWFFEAMIGSIEYQSSGTSDLTIEQTVEAMRAAIQVDGIGREMMEYLSDWELFETDTIGVGTGPVDYYYSPSANITIKYERSFDVILDIKDGETSAF